MKQIDECIVQCVRTMRGSMPFARDFGLDVTDQTGRLRRSQIQEQLSKYYPDVHSLNLRRLDTESYIASVTGVYDETSRR